MGVAVVKAIYGFNLSRRYVGINVLLIVGGVIGFLLSKVKSDIWIRPGPSKYSYTGNIIYDTCVAIRAKFLKDITDTLCTKYVIKQKRYPFVRVMLFLKILPESQLKR